MRIFRRRVKGKLSRNYYVRVSVEGREVWKSTGKSSRKEAEIWAKKYVDDLRGIANAAALGEKIRQIRSGGRLVALGDALEIYEKKPRRSRPNEDGRRLVAGVWADFCAFAESRGERHLAAVSERTAEGWVMHLREKGRYRTDVAYSRGKRRAVVLNRKRRPLGSKSANDYLQFAKRIFGAAMREAGLSDNPFAEIEPMRKDAQRRHAFTPEEIQRILKKADAFVRPLVVVAVSTGMRLGDCCRLRWDAVDLKAGFIRQAQGKSRNKTEVRCPILPTLRKMLEDLPRKSVYALPEHAERYGANRWGISQQISAVLASAGVLDAEDGRLRDFHSFRHSFVWEAAKAGVPMSVVQSMVGHLTPAMTKLYADHATDEATRAAAELLPDHAAKPKRKKKKKAGPTESEADLAGVDTAALLAEIQRRLKG